VEQKQERAKSGSLWVNAEEYLCGQTTTETDLLGYIGEERPDPRQYGTI